MQASVKARSNGEKCPICSGARVIAGINDLATLEPLLVKQWSKKNISRIIGVIMLIVAIVFIVLALNHPEKSFPWNNTITWLLYGIYFLVTVVLLIDPKMKK